MRPSDKELINRILQGESACWDLLAQRYYDEIYRYCYYRTGSEAAAADCTQDTFLHAIQGLGSYVDKNKFRAWIFRIAANSCMDHFRRNKAVCVEQEVLDMQGEEDKGLKQREDAEYVQAALMKLSEVQKEVIILKFYHGFKIREIAGLLNLTIPAVKSHLKRGMDKLGKIMKGDEET